VFAKTYGYGSEWKEGFEKEFGAKSTEFFKFIRRTTRRPPSLVGRFHERTVTPLAHGSGLEAQAITEQAAVYRYRF